MRLLTEGELDAGGLGIGVAAQYVPGMTDEENSVMFEVAGKRRSTIFVHAKFSGVQTPNTGFSAIKRLIVVAESYGAGLHIAHITSTALRDTPAALQFIAKARAHNPTISSEAYPYRRVGTTISSAYFDPGWQERYGITYSDITMIQSGHTLTAETFDDARRQGGLVTVNSIPELAVEVAFRDTTIAVASDALPYNNGKGHPRAAGTYSRVLGKFVREKKWLTLDQAIIKMTLIPAEIVARVSPQMKRKGRLQVGADADITVFNPQTITDRATYAEPMTASQGVEYVIVNGKFVVDRAKFLDDVFPGEPIYGKRISIRKLN